MSSETTPGREKLQELAQHAVRGMSAKDRKQLYYGLADAGHAPANHRPSQLAKAAAAWYSERNPEAETELGLKQVEERLQDLLFRALET